MLAGQSGFSSGRTEDVGCYSCQDRNLFPLCAFQQGMLSLNGWAGGSEGDTTARACTLTRALDVINIIPQLTGSL